MQKHKQIPSANKFHVPEFVVFIINKLETAGHQAYIVGGAVRDFCLERPILDWDIATSAPSKDIRGIFHDTNHFALKHDTVTLVDSGHHFEVTTFRGDRNSLHKDLAHRDFTFNAMSFNMSTGEIIDPNGGEQDIARKLVRTVGSPRARFREDPLRLLRAVRFATELGFKIHGKTFKGLINPAPSLDSVSPERIREELIRILMSPKPSTGFNLLVRTGLLRQFLPELLEGYRKRQNACHRFTIFKHIIQTVEMVKPTLILRLTALLHDVAKPRVRKKVDGKWIFHGHENTSSILAGEIMHRLKFSRNIINKVTNLIRNHMVGYDSSWSDAAVRRLIRRAGPEDIMDLIALHRADILAHGFLPSSVSKRQKFSSGMNKPDKLNLLYELEQRVKDQINSAMPTRTRDLAIDGNMVMEILGLSPGPEVGNILSCLMEKIIDHPLLNNKKQLTAILENRPEIGLSP